MRVSGLFVFNQITETQYNNSQNKIYTVLNILYLNPNYNIYFWLFSQKNNSLEVLRSCMKEYNFLVRGLPLRGNAFRDNVLIDLCAFAGADIGARHAHIFALFHGRQSLLIA